MLTSLRLLDFRCFTSLDVEVSSSGALLLGDNAQGKTSVLEAICMLVRVHSPRSHRMAVLARQGVRNFGIAGNPWSQQRQVRWGQEGFSFKLDGQPVSGKSAYLENGGLIVWMGNEDLDLIRGPGEGRRRYLDFIGTQIDPAYRRALSRYGRALRSKNLLLKDGRSRDAEIRSYEEIMIEHGTWLHESRQRIIEALSPLVAAAHASIGGLAETVSLHHMPASGPDMREAMIQARAREERLRQSVVGPHRDDLSLRIHGLPAADFASEGQQRTLALALKLAQGRLIEATTQRLPMYLIDDIFGELDPLRRNALMASLPENSQKWITTTHLGWLRETESLPSLAQFRVNRGNVTPL